MDGDEVARNLRNVGGYPRKARPWEIAQRNLAPKIDSASFACLWCGNQAHLDERLLFYSVDCFGYFCCMAIIIQQRI